MNCRSCGAELPPEAMFCGECGRAVAARDQEPPGAPAPVEVPATVERPAPVGPVLGRGDMPATEQPAPIPPPPAPVVPPVSAPPPAAPPRDPAPAVRPVFALDAPPPVAGTRIPDAAIPAAGALAEQCAQCGAVLAPTDIFCGECGFVRPSVAARRRPADRALDPFPWGLNPELPVDGAAALSRPASSPAGEVPPRGAPEPAAIESADPVPAAPSFVTERFATVEPADASQPEVVAPASVDTEPEPAAAVVPAEQPPVGPTAPRGWGQPPSAALPTMPVEPLRSPVRPSEPPPVPSWAQAAGAPLPPALVTPQTAPAQRIPVLDEDEVDETRLVDRTAKGDRFVLQFSTGESVSVTGTGLIGRNPMAQPGEYFDAFVAIVDPGRSVSKTHLEFGQEGGAFWVSDRWSGNGTVVREPDRSPRRAEPGKRYRAARGTRVDIGEQFFIIS